MSRLRLAEVLLAFASCAPALSQQQSPKPALAPTQAQTAAMKVFPEAPERALVVRACAACHAPELVVAKRHTPEEWDEIVAKMIDRGAVANDDEQQRILDYLIRFYGPSTSADAGAPARP